MDNNRLSNNHVPSKNLSLEVFIKDSSIFFVHKKIEKISSAIYFISNSIPNEEPLKQTLKSKSIDLIGESMSFCLSKDNYSSSLISCLFEINSIFSIAVVSGVVSQMNASVLDNEVQKLVETIKKIKESSPKTNSNSLEESFFTVEHEERILKELKSYNSSYKGHNIKDSHNNVLYNNPKDKTATGRNLSNMKKIKKSNDNKTNQRRQIILGIVQKQNFINIKDISKVIKNCGEKTIQRELTSMVKDNILHKEGDRRWSRYSLIL